MNKYYASTVGTYIELVGADTLAKAKAAAKHITHHTIHPVHILLNNELVGTLVPKLDRTGRWSFRYKAVC